ncbi:capsule polysaccharide transporter [Amylibacter ulvae]|uniref:Capsule polysaccharide transporter n=1 Tax=Paramylibacter ulvae TaxID=1651968 RepID=A0ABQ3CXA5_9RHOB|nr:capsule biosynthesis protein [Amylibacter ulvae]GHA45517.1 capsule polysaccharide transporter [Amylibacter ulvae]
MSDDNNTDQNADAASGTSILSVREEIELIKKEDLSGQQLRMARRLAQKHKIEATSDLDAVRLLRLQGIDPFSNDAALTGTAPAAQSTAGQAIGTIQLPAKAQSQEVGAPVEMDDSKRLKEIRKIQRDLVKRRRRRMMQMVAKLFMFVGLPTALAAYYFYAVATPMYSTFSVFEIQNADASAASSTAQSMFARAGISTSTDSVGTQEFITSRSALEKLDQDQGFRATFANDQVDPLQRLETDSSNEKAYRTYKKHVKVGYDPTEGVLRMEVIAPTPQKSYDFTQALVSYAEEHVNQQSERKRNDSMREADKNYREQEQAYYDAQAELLAIQEKYKTVSGDLKIQQLTSEISALRSQLIDRRLVLVQLESNSRPSKPKVDAQRASITELERVIDELNRELTEGQGDVQSIAQVTAELSLAQGRVEMRQTMLATSLQAREVATAEAIRQTRYLTLSVPPVLPDEPSYPKKFENTALSFLVFLGIFLMVSLTGSILREQISN